MPDNSFLTEQEYEVYRIKALDMVRKHQNKIVADIFETLGNETFENGGEGCYYFDMRGQRYFDAGTGGGVFALGHGNPEIVEAVCAQIRKGALSFRAGFVPKHLELLQKLSEIVPGHYQHGYIGSTGTEVIEAALRLARLTTGRPKIVSMEYSYHGMSIATISLTGIPGFHKGCPSELPYAKIIPFADEAAAEATIDNDTAAVILEPIQWAAGCRVAGTEYLQKLRKLCDERGALLIFDEMQTGMGHTGYWFAADRAGVIPDFMIIGKTISGGVVPVAAVMYADKIAEAELQIPNFLNSTYAGNPMACTAALASIKFIQDRHLLARVNELSQLIEKHLNSICHEFPDILAYHSGLGLMRCLMTSHPLYGIMLGDFLLKEHQINLPCLSYINPCMLRLSPPYIASDAEIENLFKATETVCRKLRLMGLKGIQEFMAQEQAKLTAQIQPK